MPSPVDRNTALLEIITEGARAVMLDRAVYAECNQHLTGECADLRRKLRATGTRPGKDAARVMRFVGWLRRRLGRCDGWRYVPGDLGRPEVLWCSLPRHEGQHVAQDLQQPHVTRRWGAP